jgi:hypothetical protein
VAIAPPAEGTLFRHLFLPRNVNRNIRPLLWTVINHEAPAEAAFDWVDLGEPPTTPGHRVLLVAIVRAVALQKSDELVRRANLHPVIATPRNVGLYHLARTLDLAGTDQTVLLLDRREDRIDLALVRGPQLLYCRGQAGGRSLPTRPTRLGGADSIVRQIDAALHHAREQLKEPDLTPSTVYVSGAGAASLVAELSEKTGFPTLALDPYAELAKGGGDSTQALDAEECVGAVGVALAALRRNLDDTVSLTVGRPKKIALDRDLRYYRIAVAVCLLAMGAIVFGNIYARDVVRRNADRVKAAVMGARNQEEILRGTSQGLAKTSQDLDRLALAAAAPEPVAAILSELAQILPSDYRIERFKMQPFDQRRGGLIFEQVLRVELSISVPPDTLGSETIDDVVAVAEQLRQSPVLRELNYRREAEPATDQSTPTEARSDRPRWKFIFKIQKQTI